MTVIHQGAPEYRIEGSADEIVAKANVLRQRATRFDLVAESLTLLTTHGWHGRAADRFRERYDVEPRRWADAGRGFRKAADGLHTYAEALRAAQTVAVQMRADHHLATRVSSQARAEYDRDVAQHRAEKAAWEAANGPGTYTLTILPFVDPGDELRAAAAARFNQAVTSASLAAQAATDAVRAGSVDAPERRNWLESGLAAVGGVLAGAGEAVSDIGDLLWSISPVRNLLDVATGDLTPEEFAAKNHLGLETAIALFEAAKVDPIGFGKQIGSSLLDVDTWKDDPARALGHLVPDLLAAFFTGGTSVVATRGSGAVSRFAGSASRVPRATDALEVANRKPPLPDHLIDKLTDPADNAVLERIALGPQGTQHKHTDPDVVKWAEEVAKNHPTLSKEDVLALYDYTTDDGYRTMNAALRSSDPIPADVQARIDAVRKALEALPNVPATTYRGTNLPDEVLQKLRSGKFSDDAAASTNPGKDVAEERSEPTGSNATQVETEKDSLEKYTDGAFMSASRTREIAERFLNRTGANPTLFEIEGHSGVSIADFSAARGETEILFKNGVTFEVRSIKLDRDTGIWNVSLRELP